MLTSSNNTGTDDEANQHAQPYASPDLTDESFVHCGIVLRPQCLFQEGEQHRDNDTTLQAFSKTDEKYCSACQYGHR